MSLLLSDRYAQQKVLQLGIRQNHTMRMIASKAMSPKRVVFFRDQYAIFV